MDMEKQSQGKEKKAQERIERRLEKRERALWEVFGEEEAIRRWEETKEIEEELRRLGYKEEE